MGRYLHREPLDDMHPRKINNPGEDCENLSKKEGVAHKGTWRYKKGFLDYKVLENIMKKHVNEPYEVIYKDIAKLFKTGSLERRHIEQELVCMSKPDANLYIHREGYYIIDGIIKHVQKVKGKTIILGK